MKISVIGGGPAGLYFSALLKRFRPEYKVTIYEAQNESVNALGLGYTLQDLNLTLLHKLDPNALENLFAAEKTPRITEALYKTNSESRVMPFAEGYSITRFQLLNYLRERALSLGVVIKEKKITREHIVKLKKSSDLLIGADGMASLVRQSREREFGPQTYSSNLRFSWFMNESDQERTEACFYAFNAPEGVVMLTSYPLTNNKQVVIIEASEACLDSGRFASKTPEESVPYLNELLSSNGDVISLRSANLPWYPSRTNAVENLRVENIALIGDAAFAFHFSFGQGVTTAFTMGYALVQCMLKQSDIKAALTHYSESMKLALKEPKEKSINQVAWLECLDKTFNDSDPEDWIDLFLHKQKMNKASEAALG